MVIVFIISILLFIYSFYLFSSTKKIEINNAEKIKEITNLENQINSLLKEKENINNQINQLNIRIEEKLKYFDDYCLSEYKLAEEKIDKHKNNLFYASIEYANNLEKAYNDAEIQYKQKINDINKEYENISLELNKIKSSLNAAVQANLREKEIEDNTAFYTLQLEEKNLKEIEAIKNIEYILSDPRPLRMLIWTNYYSKRANDLCNRVLGTNKIIGIYKITNLKTKEVYIGKSIDIKERWREHMKCGLGIDTPAGNKLYASMKKYGIDSFSFELLEKCTSEELNEKEKLFIDLYDSYNFGMNSNSGNGVKK